MRQQIEASHEDLQNALRKGLQEINFSNRDQSLLINGGPGLGKSHAVISDWFYQMICQKLDKPQARILILESRAATKEQLRQENTNLNIGIYHYSAFNYDEYFNKEWDLVILDEAHSFFTDSAFANKTSELFDWLCYSRTIPITFITANDVELIQMLEQSPFKGDIVSVFPNYEEEHLRHVAEVMAISLTTKKIQKVIKEREKDFFQKRKRGLFFIKSAVIAAELNDFFNSKGYRCGFYISQYNKSLSIQEVECDDEDDEENLNDYVSMKREIDVRQELDFIEKARAQNGKETIYDSLIYKGKIPEDIDFLFITDVAQEGLSLSAENNLDFIFIEDTYPLTIKQKMFRYRENAPFIFLCLSQKRIEQLLRKEMKILLDLKQASQETLRGYAMGTGLTEKNSQKKKERIWYNPRTEQWEVRENYLSLAISKARIYEEVRNIIQSGRLDDLKEIYGAGAKMVYIDTPECRFESQLVDWDGKYLGEEERNQLTELAKSCGISNNKNEYDYTWRWLKANWNSITKEYSIVNIDKKINGKRYKLQILKNR